MDDSFERKNRDTEKRHLDVHNLFHLSASCALWSGNKSQYLNNGPDFINDFPPRNKQSIHFNM